MFLHVGPFFILFLHRKREYLCNMKNKNNRLEAIRQVISEQDIKNQDQLLQVLTAMGYNVTQATLSRDLKKMKILKFLSETLTGAKTLL